MKLIDGRAIAAQIEAQLKAKVPPGLTLAILVFPDDQAGQTYTRLKIAAAARVGIKVITAADPEVLDGWAADPLVSGILIQYPGWQGREFARKWQGWINKIPPEKDVDGLRPDSKFVPATVKAVEKIIGIPSRGGMLVIGRGMIGKQLAARFQVSELSSRDKNLEEKIKTADVVITACGRPGLIKAVKPGATLIDCGWPKGDVDFERVKAVAGMITPVPGGVGPVTVVCLLENLVEAVYNRLWQKPKK